MKKLLTLAAFAAMAVLWNGCRDNSDEDVFSVLPSELNADLANDWVALAIDLTKGTPGYSPPVAARAYGYTSLTLYEALVHGMPGYRSMQGQVNGLTAGTLPEPEPDQAYHWGLVANRAMATILENMYRTASAADLDRVAQLEQLHDAALAQSASTTLDAAALDRSRTLGEAIGLAMYEYAKSDGQDACYSTNTDPAYTPPVFPGCWEPTTAGGMPLQPHWGNVRPFLTANVTDVLPPAPHAFGTTPGTPFYDEAKEVYDVTTQLTAEQETIAKFWSDDPVKTGTPPGHSLSIARQALIQENADLASAAETYAKVGMAVHDAFVSCWKAKYIHCLVRPLTYIREHIDANYTTLLNTPMFPEYTSGHSVQSGAAFTVLTDLFGDNYAFTDHTHEARTDINGTPRAFPSFMAAAEEAAISRLYGGIHFRAAIERGLDQGVKIGEHINDLNFRN